MPNLTALTICATSRVSDHLYHLVQIAPDIRSLTLSSYWRNANRYGYDPIDPFSVPVDSESVFRRLERVSVSGDAGICRLAAQLLYCSRKLSDLTLHMITDGCASTTAFMPELVEAIGQCQQPARLALSGTETGDFLEMIETDDDSPETATRMRCVKKLYLEQVDRLGDGGEEHFPYPMLSSVRHLSFALWNGRLADTAV